MKKLILVQVLAAAAAGGAYLLQHHTGSQPYNSGLGPIEVRDTEGNLELAAPRILSINKGEFRIRPVGRDARQRPTGFLGRR